MSQVTGTIVDRIELGRRLHDLRWTKGLALRDVAAKTNLPETTLSRWERARGDAYPSIERLVILAHYYRIGVSDLLDADFDTRVWLKAAA